MGEIENQGSQAGTAYSAAREFRTSIEPLDKLLGYNSDLRSGTGIRPGDIVVLRGGPGSGKTTLGLQVISRFLESDDCLYVQGLAAIFLSLEVDPARTVERVTKDFGFFTKRSDSLVPVSADIVQEVFRRSADRNRSLERRKEVAQAVTQGILRLAVPALEPLAGTVAETLTDWVMSLRKRMYESRAAPEETNGPDPVVPGQDGPAAKHAIEGILFIDSINALLGMLHQCLQMEHWEPRLALKNAVELLRRMFSSFVIVLSSEFHHESSWIASGMSESFLSDVEILLTNEPIAVPPDYKTERSGSVGYEILKIIDKVEGEEGTKLETRSFVRVLKSRKGANQSRRCAYDIVSGVGVQFYETYPGDGHILLFTENPKQKQVWDTFFKEDLPQTYPALRYEDFDRSSLQRTFLSQRRFLHVPKRTDMYVSSFDNYWINWYGELCWRRAIVDSLKERFEFTAANQPRLAVLASAIHESLMRQGTSLLKDARGPDRSSPEAPKGALRAFGAVLRNDRCGKCFLCRSCWWLLNQMMSNSRLACEAAFARVCLENGRACGDGPVARGPALLQARMEASAETVMIMSVLGRMRESTAVCCANSPIRLFCQALSRPSETIDLAKKVGELETSGMWKTGSANLLPPDAVTQLCRVLRAKTEDRASRLSDTINGLDSLIKSPMARERLTQTLWGIDPGVDDEELRKQVQECLATYIDEAGGCECAAEFSRRLREGPSRRYSLSRSDCDAILGRLFAALASQWLGLTGGKERNAPTVVDLWLKCMTGPTAATMPAYAVRYDLLTTYHCILQKRNAYRFLNVMPDEKLRLFGERRSPIIKELDDSSPDNQRPIHRPGLLFSLRDDRSFVSVPYNANISFMVYRHDLLRRYLQEALSGNTGTPEGFYATYADAVCRIYEQQREALHLSEIDLPACDQGRVRRLIEKNLCDYLREGRSSSRGPLQTWEELIALMRLMNEERARTQEGARTALLHFVIETQTFDTLLCTILELLWNCGGNLRIGPDYQVAEEQDTIGRLSQALCLLGIMLRDGIITEDSTLDATHFADRYSRPKKAGSLEGPETHKKAEDWVFARQWYSTLIELLTARQETPASPCRLRRGLHEPAFLWENDDAQFGIMPIPISLSQYFAHEHRARHVSCWGDWHLIMTTGTENAELGIDLINNLMGSQKVCERAFHCAAVPTVDAFYKLYKDSRCLNLPERRYYTPELLPDTTFVDLRKTYFKHARSRSEIFDYEHCMLEIHSLFQFVKVLARERDPKWSELKRRTRKAFKRIRALAEKTLLVH